MGTMMRETVVSPAAAAQQQQARAVAAADLVIWCTARDLSPAEQIADADECRRVTGRILTVQTKSDKVAGGDPRAELAVSAQRGVGIAGLRTAIAQQLRASGETRGEFLGSTLARCRTSLFGARDALTRAIDLASSTGADELIACELRQTLHELGVIAGDVYTDDLLDRIFSRFCIGK